MLTSIGKFSKSLSLKLLVGIIILPFVFWGMGDIFRGGNQNIVASIDKEKITTQEFINYLNRLNLNDQERKDLVKTDLLDRILKEYIGRRVVSLEVNDLKIHLSDKSLKEMIINDQTFYKDNKFSRTEYEKFLLRSGLTAPAFEENYLNQEKKRQLLSYLSDGMILPNFLIENAFHQENQIKTVSYIDLTNYYKNKKASVKSDELKKTFNENKEIFLEIYKSISFVELKPDQLTGKKEYNEDFFNRINKIENEILDGASLKKISEQNNLEIINTDKINANKKNINKVISKKIEDKLFKRIFIKKENGMPELFVIENKYYIAEITSTHKDYKKFEDKNVQNILLSQIDIKNKIVGNTDIIKNISSGSFTQNEMQTFAKKNNLEIKTVKIKNLNDNLIFKKSIIKEIYKTKKNNINLITDSKLENNFIILTKNTEKIKFNTDSKDYANYKSKAKIMLAQSVYETYDKSINQKYKVELNQKVINRIKNTF